jgi:hypothetical protein
MRQRGECWQSSSISLSLIALSYDANLIFNPIEVDFVHRTMHRAGCAAVHLTATHVIFILKSSTLKFRGHPRLTNRLVRLVHTSVPFARSVRLTSLGRWWVVRCIFSHVRLRSVPCVPCVRSLEIFALWSTLLLVLPSKRVDTTRAKCTVTARYLQPGQDIHSGVMVVWPVLYLPSLVISLLLFQASQADRMPRVRQGCPFALRPSPLVPSHLTGVLAAIRR